MPGLLLAEHEYQVRNFIGRGLAAEAKWLALGPSAMASLDALGIDYAIPEDFYAGDEFESFCDGTHKHVEFLCSYLDERLLSFYPELESKGLTPFRFHIFHLMMVFDAVRGRAFQLRKISQAHSQQTIYIHDGPRFPLKSNDLLFSNSETLWGHVASLTRSCFEVLPDALPQAVVRPTESSRAGVKNQVLKSMCLTSAARLLSSRNYHGLWNLVGKRRKTFLVVNAPYEWADVLTALSKAGHQVLFISDEYFRNHQPKTTDPSPQGSFEWADSDATLKTCCDVNEISTYELLRERLAQIWGASPQQFIVAGQKFGELQARQKISAVLRCSSASGLDHAINQLARTHEVPVFVWQHGAVSYHKRITQFRDYADLMSADYMFVYGEEVEKAYRHHGMEFKTKIIPIGAPSLDSISVNGKRNQAVHSGRPRRILYATTNYMQNHWYCGWTPAFSDREFFRDQLLIVNRLVSLGRAGLAKVIVKIHPSIEYQTPSWILEVRSEAGVRVVRNEESFEELLNASDAIILDFPSTTLLQSLAAGLPVFALLKHCQFHPAVHGILKKRVVISNDADQLLDGLVSFIHGDYAADLNERTFLNTHGTYLGDSKSVERAIKALAQNIDYQAVGSGLTS